MSPERVSVGEEEGHSMLNWKTEKARGTNSGVWCEESGGWKYQKRSGEYGRACKVEDSHRDKTEQCPGYIYSRECLSCIEFFVGLEKLKRVLCGQFLKKSVWGEQHSSVCDRGSRQTRNERIAVVKAWQNEWGDQSHCSLSGKILLDRTNLMELVVAGFGSLTDEVLHGQWRRMPRLLTESESGTVVWSSWRVLTEIEDSFGPVPMSIVSLFSLFGWSLFCVIQFLMSK